MDANFRLKNHLVSNFSTDPGLGNGMAYMTPRLPYETYVLSQADAEDVRYPHRFSHLVDANVHLDQHLRRVPGPCQSDHSKHSRTALYWCERRFMWSK